MPNNFLRTISLILPPLIIFESGPNYQQLATRNTAQESRNVFFSLQALSTMPLNFSKDLHENKKTTPRPYRKAIPSPEDAQQARTLIQDFFAHLNHNIHFNELPAHAKIFNRRQFDDFMKGKDAALTANMLRQLKVGVENALLKNKKKVARETRRNNFLRRGTAILVLVFSSFFAAPSQAQTPTLQPLSVELYSDTTRFTRDWFQYTSLDTNIETGRWKWDALFESDDFKLMDESKTQTPLRLRFHSSVRLNALLVLNLGQTLGNGSHPTSFGISGNFHPTGLLSIKPEIWESISKDEHRTNYATLLSAPIELVLKRVTITMNPGFYTLGTTRDFQFLFDTALLKEKTFHLIFEKNFNLDPLIANTHYTPDTGKYRAGITKDFKYFSLGGYSSWDPDFGKGGGVTMRVPLKFPLRHTQDIFDFTFLLMGFPIAAFIWLRRILARRRKNPAAWNMSPLPTALPRSTPYHRLTLIGAVFGIALFFIGGYFSEHMLNHWILHSPRLLLMSLETISVYGKLLGSILYQLHSYKGASENFRLRWKPIFIQLAIAMLFSAVVEGAWYEIGLPHLIPGQGFKIAVLRGFVDQIPSLFFLDPINRFLQSRFVEHKNFKDAVRDVRLNTMSFYLLSAPLWLIAVIAANSLPMPIMNYIMINTGMMAWDFLLYWTNSKEGELWVKKASHWMTIYAERSHFSWRILRAFSIFKDWAQLHFFDQHWLGTYLLVSVSLAYALALGWFIFPLLSMAYLLKAMWIGTVIHGVPGQVRITEQAA